MEQNKEKNELQTGEIFATNDKVFLKKPQKLINSIQTENNMGAISQKQKRNVDLKMCRNRMSYQ